MEKRDFIYSNEWKKFRQEIGNKTKTDLITGSKLLKGWNLHHKDLDAKHYTDISNSDNFIALNKKTHSFIHWLYNYYKKDNEIISRIVDLLDEMVELNNGSSTEID